MGYLLFLVSRAGRCRHEYSQWPNRLARSLWVALLCHLILGRVYIQRRQIQPACNDQLGFAIWRDWIRLEDGCSNINERNRKSVVWGKRESVSVNLEGSRISKKKKQNIT